MLFLTLLICFGMSVGIVVAVEKVIGYGKKDGKDNRR